MAVENLKSLPITNLDAVPIVRNTTGEGAPAYVYDVGAFVTLSAAASVASTYKMVRLASNAKVKSVILENEAQGAGKVNVSVFYSDGANDGTPPALAGTIVPTTGDQFFAADVDLAAAVQPGTNVVGQSGKYNISKRNQPFWQALGLASDPGGFFDIVLVVHTTAVTTGTGRVLIRAEFCI